MIVTSRTSVCSSKGHHDGLWYKPSSVKLVPAEYYIYLINLVVGRNIVVSLIECLRVCLSFSLVNMREKRVGG